MRRKLFIMLFATVFASSPLSGQTPAPSNPCTEQMFQKYIADGKRLQLEKDGFQEALKRYFAAKDCMPERAEEVDDLILEMFRKIDGQRVEARQKAIEAEKAKAEAEKERQRAKEQAEIARQNEETANKALADLAEVSNALVQEFIKKADTAIYYLDYETAVANTEKAALFDFSKNFKPKITKLWMELIFWYHESHQYERAQKLTQQSLEYIKPAKPLSIFPIQERSHHLAQAELFSFLDEVDPDNWIDMLKARYYLDLVPVAGGTFTMGCDTLAGDSGCENDEFPPRQITVSDFKMARTETTLWQYGLYCAAEPGFEIENYAQPKDLDWGIKGPLPAIFVSWWDAAGYSNWLNKQFGRDTVYVFFGEYDFSQDDWPDSVSIRYFSDGGHYRLPTEAEWEFAARGGVKAKERFRFTGSNNLDSVGWYGGNSDNRVHLVGTKAPNELGLYDVSGNLWEWCQDWYGAYQDNVDTDPQGPPAGEYRVLRGGSWDDYDWDCRVSNRDYDYPWYWYNVIYGFRLSQD